MMVAQTIWIVAFTGLSKRRSLRSKRRGVAVYFTPDALSAVASPIAGKKSADQ
jgi:hypothetical protein